MTESRAVNGQPGFRPSGPRPGLTGSGVVVGIIDFGFDYTLADFRHPDGTTRVAYLWDQRLKPQGGEKSPSGCAGGVEYDSTAINAALRTADPFTVVRHQPVAGSHGTHVAGIAVGNGRSGDDEFPAGRHRSLAHGAIIVFVHLSRYNEPEFLADSPALESAIRYIFGKADELGTPCVVNISLGECSGAHDGSSSVERVIDELLQHPGRAVVIAAGNLHALRGHASGHLENGETRTLNWRIGGDQPDAARTLTTRNNDVHEMDVWYPSGIDLHVWVTSPSGASTRVHPVAAISKGCTLTTASGSAVWFIPNQAAAMNGDSQILVHIEANAAAVAAGVWQLHLRAGPTDSVQFNAWIQRSIRDPLTASADQSVFADSDFDPTTTLATPATSLRAITVANYDSGTNRMSPTSGRGPTRDGRQKPDVAAPGTDIVSSFALGGRPDGSGGIHPMRRTASGTSASAPKVAGLIARLFELNPRLSAARIRTVLVESARPTDGRTGFEIAWGYGRVDASGAIMLAEQLDGTT